MSVFDLNYGDVSVNDSLHTPTTKTVDALIDVVADDLIHEFEARVYAALPVERVEVNSFEAIEEACVDLRLRLAFVLRRLKDQLAP